eukprot:288350_1
MSSLSAWLEENKLSKLSENELKKLKSAILAINNIKEEHKDDNKEEDDSDDDCRDEAFIDPLDQTRRKAIWDTPNANDGVIKCIGSLRIVYADKNKLTNADIMLGTATVFDVDHHGNCFILTAAHNGYQFLRKCVSCNISTVRRRCKCGNICRRVMPLELIKATNIEFASRCIVKKVTDPTTGEEKLFGDPLATYEIDNFVIH